MAERVEIIIAARNQFGRVFQGVQRQVRDFQQGARLNQLDRSFQSIENNAKAATTGVSGLTTALRTLRNVIAPLVGIQLFVTAIRTVAQFEERMAGVQAVTGAAIEEMERLTATARELGATTRFSASEAAAGMEFLGRAGFRATEIIDAMAGVLDLAAAGQLGLAEAADIASNVLQGFGEAADQSNRAADILARTAAISNTNVSQLGQAMSFVAPVAAQLGVSMEDTAAAIGALSNAGVQGTRAGTSLRKVLSTLAALTPKQKAQFEALGIATDRLNVQAINPLTGQTNTLVDVMKALGEANLTTAQNFALFGDRGAIGATVLVEAARAADESTASLVSLTKQTNTAEGTAAELARVMSDNIPGAFRNLISAVQEVILQIGDAGLGGGIRNAIDGLTIFFRAMGGATLAAEDANSTMAQLGRTVLIIGQTFRDVFGSLSLDISASVNEVNLLSSSLQGIAFLLAGVRDGFSIIVAGIARAGEVLARVLIRPVQTLLSGLSRVAGVLSDDLQESIDAVKNSMDALVDAPKAVADEITGQFLRGETATQRLIARLKGTTEAEEEVADGAEDMGNALADAANKAQKEVEDLQQALSLEELVSGNTEAQFSVFKDTVERNVADLERQLEEGTISLQQFTQQRLALQQELIDKEIELKQEQRESAEQIADQAKLAAEILVLQAERRELANQATRDQAEAERQLAEDLRKVRVELAELSGQPLPIGDIETEIRDKYKDLVESLKAEGDTAGQEIVESLINRQIAERQFSELEARAERAFNNIKTAQEALQTQVELGILSEQDARDQLSESTAQNKAEIEGLIPELQRMAEAVGDPEMIARVQQIGFELQTVGNVASQAAVRINSTLKTGLTDFFVDVTDGTKSVKDAFLDLGRSIIDTIQKIAAENLAQAVLGGIGGAAGGGGGAAGGLGGLIAGALGFASGGYVSGPGTGTSDSIPARLSDGEYVVRAAAVQKYGAGLFEALNGMIFPRMSRAPVSVPRVPKFADGGLVKDSGSGGGQASGASFRIINVTDPNQIDNFINSASGERAILNVIRRNSTGVKQVLG